MTGTKPALAVAAALLLLGAAACGSGTSNNANGAKSSDPTTAITARMNSLVGHINDGDAKAILDDDVPTSARRTCSDKDAKSTIDAVRQQMPNGAKLTVNGVQNVQVNGNKATATVMIGVTDVAQAQPTTLPFVKNGGTWLLDTSGSDGCNGLLLRSVS